MADVRRSFSSADFGRTPDRLVADRPERLIHRAVEGTSDAPFSSERRHPVFVVDLPSLTMSMSIGVLEPGQATNRHRHSYETIIYVLEGSGVTTIEDQTVRWTAGDAIYVPVWAWHQHENGSSVMRCRYVACENAPLLQNLGGLAIREEGPA
jgi:gentisate 1,2-dioxygenase